MFRHLSTVTQYAATLCLRDPSYVRDGQLYPGDVEIVTLPYVAPEECSHGDQELIERFGSRVCSDCLDSWLFDWEVRLPADL